MRMRVVLLVVVLLTGACSGGGTNPSGNSGGSSSTTGSNTFSAKVDGVTWTARSTRATYVTDSTGKTLGVNGGDASGLSFQFGVTASTPGTYSINGVFGPPGVIATLSITSNNGGSQAWGAGGATGSGSVTITSITQTGASGTFIFNLPPTITNPTLPAKVVTDGVFNVTF